MVSHRKALDGKPVRVVGEFQLGMEITSLWQVPGPGHFSNDRSSLALSGGLSQWLRLREFEGRGEEGVPPSSDGRAITLWLFDQFAGHVVEFLGMVDAENRGHLASHSAGLYILSIAKP